MAAFVASVIVVIILVFGVFCVISNWAFLCLNWRNRKESEWRHISPMPLVAQLSAYIAALVSVQFGVTWIPNKIFWAVALLDSSLWQILALPFVFVWNGLGSLLKRNA